MIKITVETTFLRARASEHILIYFEIIKAEWYKIIWGKYAEPIKEKTNLEEIAANQKYDLETLENYDSSLMDEEELKECLKLL